MDVVVPFVAVACVLSTVAIIATKVYRFVCALRNPQDIWHKDLLDITQEDLDYLRLRCSNLEFRYIQNEWHLVHMNLDVWQRGVTVHSTLLDFYNYEYKPTS